ncbi:hypothetical protein Tco_0386984 [Tanacetum coccineum]
MKTKSTRKEKVDVLHGKGIDLLSEVALAKKAQLKEVRKKSLRDFHKTHPSGSGTGAEKPPSVEKITPTVTSEGTDDSNNKQELSNDESEPENDSEEQTSDSEQEEEYDDDDQGEEEFVHTPSPTDDKDDDNLELESDDVSEKDKGMNDTTDQFDDDVDTRLEEPTQTGKEVVQEQVVDDAHVTITTVAKKTEVPATSSSRSSDLESKFLNFSDIPHTDAEIVSPFDVPVQHEVPNTQTTTLLPIPVSVITTIPQALQTFTPPPLVITTLEKEVAEIKKDPLHTQVTSLVDEHLDTRLGETREEFVNFLSETLTARIKEQVKDPLPQILPKEVSNFAPPVIEKLIKESRNEVTLAKVSSQPQSTYEAASTLTEFELKNILIDKIEKSESYLAAPEH